MKRSVPWINRHAADEIYDGILAQKRDKKRGVTVHLVKADAGAGKTFLARDIGTRLGSTDGYEPSAGNGILWSGILDLYDPGTNNNRGLETLLIRAFSKNEDEDFKEYHDERKIYVKIATGGTGGPPLEIQRRNVERAFSRDIRSIAQENHLVWAFDAVERLDSALDPTEAEFGKIGEIEDTASVTGWLLDQITRLSNATILLFGRPTKHFENRLKAAIDEENFNRERTPERIHFKTRDLSFLSKEEVSEFFRSREKNFPDLKKILTKEIKTALLTHTNYNPLLLDIALQAILVTGKFEAIVKELTEKDKMKETGKALLNVYMNYSTPERKTVLELLAFARNGLTSDLLNALEPEKFTKLNKELLAFAKLPFVKTRHLFSTFAPAKKQTQQASYFLHDIMYVICDETI